MAQTRPVGVWHTTTLQTAKEHQQTYQTTPVVGHKRTIDEARITQQQQQQQQQQRRRVPETTPQPQSQHAPPFLQKQPPPRLKASPIVHVATNNNNNNRNDNNKDSAAATMDTMGMPLSEYSQRRAFPSTPTPTTDPLLSLSHRTYGLPPQLVANFAALGIRTIYPWQKQCLLGPGLLAGEANLVYSAPTGGGKSLVADVLMLKRVLGAGAGRDAKALLVLPYVALVQEKVRWLRRVVQGVAPAAAAGEEDEGREAGVWAKRADEDTVRVVGFFGGSKVKATWADFDIAVCTIEKANILVNAAIDDCSISKLKAVVLDELHMIDDDYRGYLLELMATKLLCLGNQVQVIGMSATLTNIELLRKWLQGYSYETHYRPVPIEEHLVYDGEVYAAGSTCGIMKAAARLSSSSQSTQGRTQLAQPPIRAIAPSEHKELKDPVLNAVVALANETVRAGYGVLVFSSSRMGCESDALLISRVLPAFSEADLSIQEKRLDLLGDLRSLSTGIDATLEQTIPVGVAFHHVNTCLCRVFLKGIEPPANIICRFLQAGITTEERDLIANAFDSGILKVCVATCSLAAGINLPARRVILHNVRMGRDLVGPSMLRQMRGRAGRKGKDEIGETYLCCRQKDLEDVLDLMQADLPQISSCLISDKRRIKRALLEAIAIRLATGRESLDEYVHNTMLSYSADAESIQENVDASLTDLQAMGFIAADALSNFKPTELGRAVVAAGLDPDDAVFIHAELRRALQAFVLDGEMHVLYSFTPVQHLDGPAAITATATINWRVFWNEMERLDESGLRVMGFLGLKPVVVSKMLRGGSLKETTPEEKETARRYHRFYLALQLRDLCNEVPVHRVAKKYDVPRGAVQNLQQTCQGFAAGMIKFCEQMGWGAMAAALDHFSDRLKAGAKADLLALAKITFIKSRTARVFWDNGFKTVAAVANADPKDLVPVLMQAQPNKVRLAAKDEQKFKEKLLAKAQVIADSANRLWQMQMQQDVDEE